jgi:crotonyl-CoA carboxylase/reductase
VARAAGALPVAVVSTEAKAEYCRKLGAIGVVNRREFDHWGPMPSWRDADAHGRWLAGVRRFGRAIWDVVGARRNPRIVVEHPGEETLPTSLFVCDAGGMVVTCAGTTGYNGVVDLRHLWMRQKRLQGSHFANQSECRALNDLVTRGLIDPCVGRTFPFDGIGEAHQLMYENRLNPGNATALVGARRTGLRRAAQSLVA